MKIARSQIIIIIVIIGLIGAVYALDLTPKVKSYIERKSIERENQKVVDSIKDENKIIPKVEQTETSKEEPNMETNKEPIESSPLPSEIYLEVPFICQAPLQTEQNWTYHEESCEEAALLQAFLFENNMTVTKEKANEIILDMIEWQKNFFGYHKDLYAEDMKLFITNFYGLEDSQVNIVEKVSLSDIKALLNEGHPVIAPVTSAMLNNPYYPYPGYHMLLIKGYTDEKIITNDNGTRRGEDFTYNIDTFMKALHDGGDFIITLNLNTN